MSDAEQLAKRFLDTDGVVAVHYRGDGSTFRLSSSPIAAGRQEPRYTTTEMLATERRVVEHAMARRHAGVGPRLPGR